MVDLSSKIEGAMENPAPDIPELVMPESVSGVSEGACNAVDGSYRNSTSPRPAESTAVIVGKLVSW